MPGCAPVAAANKQVIENVGPRVAIMAPAGAEYVVSTWATWMAGGYIPSMLYLECIWCNPAKQLTLLLGLTIILKSRFTLIIPASVCRWRSCPPRDRKPPTRTRVCAAGKLVCLYLSTERPSLAFLLKHVKPYSQTLKTGSSPDVQLTRRTRK